MFQLGGDTRAGLEFLLSRTLRWWQEDARYANKWWRLDDRQLIDLLASELDLHPDPRRGVESDASIEYDVPAGWRHHDSADGIGVFAPAAAFTDRQPFVDQDVEIEPVVAEAPRRHACWTPATQPPHCSTFGTCSTTPSWSTVTVRDAYLSWRPCGNVPTATSTGRSSPRQSNRSSANDLGFRSAIA